MIRHQTLAPFMGGIMGLFMGWMFAKGQLAQAGLGFVLAHVAVIAALCVLALFLPGARRFVRGHFTNRRMLARMLGTMALGFGAALLINANLGG